MLLSPKQIEFARYGNHRWNFKGGATRSGKTYLDFKWIIPMRIRERAGKDGLSVILGVTKSTIERNVLEPICERFQMQGDCFLHRRLLRFHVCHHVGGILFFFLLHFLGDIR